MPSWLAAYPGATVQTRTASGLIEETYQTPAPLADVVAHYSELFAEAKLPFHPQVYGSANVIRGNTVDSSVTIQIYKRGIGTFVRVTCSQRPQIPKITAEDIRRDMAKYDEPVYPTPRKPMPPLKWPLWLTGCDGAALRTEKGVDRFKLDYLKAAFDSQQERAEIQQFYVSLLQSHGYRVTIESSALTPLDRPAVIEGAHNFDQPGPRFVIRAELTAADDKVHVELRMTAHP